MRIRVDTDDLQAKAKDVQSAADAFGQAGDDILNVAISLPSYEGQLSGPARAAAYEIQRQSREVQTGLASDAQSLRQTAQDYEAVDNQAIDALGANQASLTAYTPEYALLGTESDGGSPSGEDKDYPHPPYDRMVAGTDIAYYYQPENKTIIVFINGKFYVYPFDPNDPSVPPEPYRGIIEKVLHNCDDGTVAATNLDGDLLLAGIGLIPEVGDVATIIGILWTTLRECQIDWSDISSTIIINEIKGELKAEGLENLSKMLTPVLGMIAAIPGIEKDFEAMGKVYAEVPSAQELQKLSDPNNGVVIKVKDDIVDHNGFSPVPMPQLPQSTPTPFFKMPSNSSPAAGGSGGNGSSANPPVVPTPSQTPTETPTPTSTQTLTPPTK